MIATSRLLFGPTQVNPEIVRDIFLPAYKQIPSPALEIDLSYTESKITVDNGRFHIVFTLFIDWGFTSKSDKYNQISQENVTIFQDGGFA